MRKMCKENKKILNKIGFKFINLTIIFLLLSANLFATQTNNDMGTITIKAVDSSLSGILSILAEESGYNIVTGPNVTSTEKITINLQDAEIDQAIDMIVRAAGLSYEIQGNSILIANADRLNSDVGVSSHVISLKYANAEDVVSLLSNITEKITVDKAGNNLLVTVSPKKLSEIKAIINDVDKPAVQIMLEAKLIEVSLSNEDKEGIDWAKLSELTTILAETGSPIELAGGGTTSSLMPGSSWATSSDGLVTETLTPQAFQQLPSEMYFQRVDGGMPTLSRQLTAFEVTLDFLMKNNRADILTNSQVVTLNGHEATISMVDVVPYILSSGGLGGQVQVQREEIGIKLHILPTVNTDGYITTSVRPEVSSIYEFIGPDRNIPWIKKRESTTTIRVMDNQSIIIGGLISLDKKRVQHRIPILSSIPYLGERLFTHSSEIESKTDLVIQITPKIIYDNYSGINKSYYHLQTEEDASTYGEKNISGFRFNHTGCVTEADGGIAEANDFTISTSQSEVIVFSFVRELITKKNGIILKLNEDITSDCLSNITFTNLDGTNLISSWGKKWESKNKNERSFTCGDNNSMYEDTGEWPDANICLFLDNGDLEYYTIKKKPSKNVSEPIKVNDNETDKDNKEK